ncbi:MAG: hypothetical protein V1897_06745, partial [Pseudomonadota bacterium]
GLSEHFEGVERLLINKSHFDLLKKGGMTFISVPNSLNPPYRIFKLLAETLGVWKFGEEYPYARAELKNICNELNVKQFFFLGDSIYQSFNFINPLKAFKKHFHIKPNFKLQNIKMEKGTPLDEYLSYALVLCAVKD